MESDKKIELKEKPKKIKCEYSIQSLTGGLKNTSYIQNICILRNPTEQPKGASNPPICDLGCRVSLEESYPLITVGALIFNKKGQILFLKSNKWKGQYGIPAGKLHYGEKIIDGLRREVREETHIEVYDIKFLLTQEIINLGGFFKKAHYVSINFACKAKNSNVRLNYEAESYSWIRPEGALKYNLNKPTKELVQCYLKLSNKDKITIKELE